MCGLVDAKIRTSDKCLPVLSFVSVLWEKIRENGENFLFTKSQSPELPEELEIDQTIWEDDTTVATLVAFPDASVLGEGSGLEAVPTWIIVVSVLVGLVVVSLIGGTLYKLGFFRRNRVPEDVMISAKVTSQNGNGAHHSMMDDYIS